MSVLRVADPGERPDVPVFLMGADALDSTAILDRLSRSLIHVASPDDGRDALDQLVRGRLVAVFDVDALPELAGLLLRRRECPAEAAAE